VLVILVGLELSELKGMNLFAMTQRLGILIGTPILHALVLGLIVRRTPPGPPGAQFSSASSARS